MKIFHSTEAERKQFLLRLQNRPQTRGKNKEHYDSPIDSFASFQASRERVAKGWDLLESRGTVETEKLLNYKMR